jgi:hypothetical protein
VAGGAAPTRSPDALSTTTRAFCSCGFPLVEVAHGARPTVLHVDLEDHRVRRGPRTGPVATASGITLWSVEPFAPDGQP